jgi:ATP-dependent RNA helicase DeaD
MLPFEPTAERPGYCLSCFSERNGGDAKANQGAKNDERPLIKPTRQRRPVRDAEPAREPRAARPTRSTRQEPKDSPPPRDSAIERAGDTPHPEVFEGLNIQARTRSALSRMGITSPTPIQEQAIPWLLEGRDVVGQAMTGSGKTLAFGIPLVEGSDRSATGVQGLVLVPTRELAIQVASVIEEVSVGRVSVQLLYGGRGIGGEKKSLQKGTQIVVGTPGRTLDHLRQGNLALGAVRMLVLDEADEMLDRGFARDVEAILAATPTKRQTALFSATLPDWVEKTANKHLRDPKTVQVIPEEGDQLKIEHLIYRIDKPAKIAALQTLLDQRDGAPIIVFGRTKHGVKKLAKQLVDAGYPVGPLQGNMSQNAREKVMADFRSGATPVLVATNVAARGLDVEGIAQVINFDLPDSLQLFTHRVGRTGRMGKSGEAITFITPDDDKKWREIERGFETSFTIKRWGDSGAGTTQAPDKRQAAAAHREAQQDSSPRQASPRQASPRQGGQQRQPSQRPAAQRQAPRQDRAPQREGQRQQANRPQRGQAQRDGAGRGNAERGNARGPERGNARPQERGPARGPAQGNGRQPERGNALPNERENIQPDTPQHVAEQRDIARSTHTPPPRGGQPKRSPWLRFGRRD